MSLPGPLQIRLYDQPRNPTGPITCVLLAALALVIGMSVAQAHPGTTGFATLTLGEQGLRYELVLDAEALSAWTSSTASVDTAGMRALATAAAEKLKVSGNRTRCELQRTEFTPGSPDRPAITIVLAFACVPAPDTITVRDDLPDLLGDAHHTLALFVWAGGSNRFTFDADSREVRVDLASGTMAETSVDLASIGFKRVLLGPEYLLFALCLLLAKGRARNVIGLLAACVICQVIAFSIASAGLFHLPVRAGETLAALAVACLAAAMIVQRGGISRYGWIAATAFGIVQGLAAWPALADVALTSVVSAASLAGYVLGVAAAQFSLLLLPLPLARRLRNDPGSARTAAVAAAIVLAAGIGLAGSRLLF
jgi:hypothetical protein